MWVGLMKLLILLKAEFEQAIDCSFVMTDKYLAEAKVLCSYLEGQTLRSKAQRKSKLLKNINSKFGFNRQGVSLVYKEAASQGFVFNYHEKNLIQSAFDSSCMKKYLEAIQKTKNSGTLFSKLRELFLPVSEIETLKSFRSEILNPSKLRSDKGERSIDNDILTSVFSSFLFSVADEQVLHQFFDSSYDADSYQQSHWLQLRQQYPNLYSRKSTLDIVCVNQILADKYSSYEKLLDFLFSYIASSYINLDNYGHLSFWIEPIVIEGRNISAELCSDIMLFSEKHDEVNLDKTYFRSKQIRSETLSYISDIDEDLAKFEVANEGFSYRDTFICPPNSNSSMGDESFLLLFQKNKRDETLITCPACRSHNVRGNSYSSLGVKSWECCNLLCPDRSKYNRGKRYSFKALLMQEAIVQIENQIPVELVRKWARDVQVGRSKSEALEMLIRFYSLYKDGISILGFEQHIDLFGRKINKTPVMNTIKKGISKQFFQSAWFKRYAYSTKNIEFTNKVKINKFEALTIVQGDSATALSEYPKDHFDCAVTSPPYFNARDYSQWPNIYCYLRDMQHIAEECFRVLQPGAVYLYNIFDYFDNERSIVFSAMGNKRLILSAYTVDIFRRVGFQLVGNVTWDKGEIEGKRGFNAGNFSPYYQAPFNCWEHILVFKKPGIGPALASVLPSVLSARPVMKMFKGENNYGHTAPYPIELPALLKEVVSPGVKVLDPFGGSGTTARAMIGHALEVVCIEQKEEYCELALQMYKAEIDID